LQVLVTLSLSGCIQPTLTQNLTPSITWIQISSASPITATAPVSNQADAVLVLGGEFIMGSDNGNPDESPIHPVFVDAFYVDRTEITNEMFSNFIQATGYLTDAERIGGSLTLENYLWELTPNAFWYQPQGLGSSIADRFSYPVVHVSWNDAQMYCDWAGGRLPTEAEWEKAARGNDGNVFPWGDQKPSGLLANFADISLGASWGSSTEDDGYRGVAPVGSYIDGQSPYGLFDMAGNVWEWVSDWYAEDYYRSGPDENPVGPSAGIGRVQRGGSWYDNWYSLRTTDRLYDRPENSGEYLGFRCVYPP
jgi:serine/threonine-protein kinase